MTSYTVRLPLYEGPLDLLLELIERAELDITKIALAQVTDQYLAHLRQMAHETWRPGFFLVVAARCCRSSPRPAAPPAGMQPGEKTPATPSPDN
jgi:segregation and condensation protein A